MHACLHLKAMLSEMANPFFYLSLQFNMHAYFKHSLHVFLDSTDGLIIAHVQFPAGGWRDEHVQLNNITIMFLFKIMHGGAQCVSNAIL